MLLYPNSFCLGSCHHPQHAPARTHMHMTGSQWPCSTLSLWPGPPPTTAPCDQLAPFSPAAPPRCAILECTHVCSIDYTVVLGLGDLLEDFHRQGVTLAFVGLQVGVPRGTRPGLFTLKPAGEVGTVIVPTSGWQHRGQKPSCMPRVPQEAGRLGSQLGVSGFRDGCSLCCTLRA